MIHMTPTRRLPALRTGQLTFVAAGLERWTHAVGVLQEEDTKSGSFEAHNKRLFSLLSRRIFSIYIAQIYDVQSFFIYLLFIFTDNSQTT
jgi:hypothetical protein